MARRILGGMTYTCRGDPSDHIDEATMLSYKASYRMQLGAFTAVVLDFPEATAFGTTLAEARNNLALSLRYAAERLLRRGEALPVPDPLAADGEAYLVEALTVWPQSADRVSVRAG